MSPTNTVDENSNFDVTISRMSFGVTVHEQALFPIVSHIFI
jgi:hypothetical protein